MQGLDYGIVGRMTCRVCGEVLARGTGVRGEGRSGRRSTYTCTGEDVAMREGLGSRLLQIVVCDDGAGQISKIR